MVHTFCMSNGRVNNEAVPAVPPDKQTLRRLLRAQRRSLPRNGIEVPTPTPSRPQPVRFWTPFPCSPRAQVSTRHTTGG